MKPDDPIQTDPSGRRRVWVCAELPMAVPSLLQGGKLPWGFREASNTGHWLGLDRTGIS